LIESIIGALERQVAPAVQDKWASSVLRSATQLLNHIALRTESEARVLIEDNQDVRQVLEGIAPRLARGEASAALHAAVEEALHMAEAAPYDSAALDLRNEAYQVAVELVLKHRDTLQQATGDSSACDELCAYLQRRQAREHHLYFPVFTGPPF